MKVTLMISGPADLYWEIEHEELAAEPLIGDFIHIDLEGVCPGDWPAARVDRRQHMIFDDDDGTTRRELWVICELVDEYDRSWPEVKMEQSKKEGT